MEQQDWQDIWQDLEDVYDKVREKKRAGDTAEERIINIVLDCILDDLDGAQMMCEAAGAVPVEPVDCPEHESSDQCHSPEDHEGDGPCRCVYSGVE